jgi:hypothetical protein
MRGRLATMLAWGASLACLLTMLAAAADPADARAPRGTFVSHAEGRLVPIPRDIPHQAGAYIDKRVIPNIRFIHRRYGIYITEGYAGRIPGVGVVGCPDCHVTGSDHFTGLALDIAAPSGSTSCDRSWRRITALAKWAEPRQDIVRRPFRWVGYDGDSGHGCGHHLHLSWNAAPTPSFRIADWVELFRVRKMNVDGADLALRRSGGIASQDGYRSPGPTGGVSVAR